LNAAAIGHFDLVLGDASFTPPTKLKRMLAELVRVFGADRVLMGTDYPFDMGEYDPIGHVASVETFDASTVAHIAGGNARRLLGL